MNDNNIEKYQKAWQSGLPETPCGSGSKMENTKQQREWIPEIIKNFNIKTISDIGAGDLNWISTIGLPDDVTYTPYDLVPRHPKVVEFDLLANVPPKSDLIICLWLLNHLPREQQEIAMENIKSSGSRYLMITNTPKWNQYYIEDFDYIDMLPLIDYNAEIRFIEL